VTSRITAITSTVIKVTDLAVCAWASLESRALPAAPAKRTVSPSGRPAAAWSRTFFASSANVLSALRSGTVTSRALWPGAVITSPTAPEATRANAARSDSAFARVALLMPVMSTYTTSPVALWPSGKRSSTPATNVEPAPRGSSTVFL
jgi:hypothetical protein